MNFTEIPKPCFNKYTEAMSHCKLPSRLECLFKIGLSWPHFKMRTTDKPRKINGVQYLQFLVVYTHFTYMLWQWQTRATIQQWIPFFLVHLWPGFPSHQASARQWFQRQFTEWSFYTHKSFTQQSTLEMFSISLSFVFQKWNNALNKNFVDGELRKELSLGGVSNTSDLY